MWVNDEFIQAAARYYQRPIVVIKAQSRGNGIHVESEHEAAFNTDIIKFDKNIIYIYHTGGHYDLLVHKDQNIPNLNLSEFGQNDNSR